MDARTTTLGTALMCLAVALAPVAARGDDAMPRDAGFEQRLDPDAGGWRLFGPSRYSTEVARGGDVSMFNGGSSRSVAYPPYFVGTVSGSYQEFPAEPGSRWRMTGYGLTRDALVGAPAFGIVQVSFFSASGKDLGTVETEGNTSARAKLSNEVNNGSPVGEWVYLDTGVATAPAGTATVQAFTLFVDYSGENRFQGVHFDDVRLCALDAAGGGCDAPGD